MLFYAFAGKLYFMLRFYEKIFFILWTSKKHPIRNFMDMTRALICYKFIRRLYYERQNKGA